MRARQLLDCGDDEELPLAALCLRLSIEAIVRRKLRDYSSYIPHSVLRTWQPPHALKMLVQFEPHADQNCEILFSRENDAGEAVGPWVNLGEHRTFSVKWLQKNYHKLGNYLHHPMDECERDSAAIRSGLEAIASEVTSVLESPVLGFTLAKRVSFDCCVCNTACLANADGLHETGTAICSRPSCGAVHLAIESEDHWQFALEKIDVNCVRCESHFMIEKRYMASGNRFMCPECGASHVVMLGYSLESEPASH